MFIGPKLPLGQMTPTSLFLRLDMSKDETTFKLLNTLKSTRTQIHKPNLAGRPKVSGNGGPTERISSFIASLIQPIDRKQKLYIKDTTDFVHFVENKRHFQTTQSSLLYIYSTFAHSIPISHKKKGIKLFANTTTNIRQSE